MHIIVGLTGGIGSGKTFVSNCFQGLGADIVDADVISRNVTAQNQPSLVKIAEHFGPQIIDASGHLDRASLRKIIFTNQTEKKWLEELLHPIIRDNIIEALNLPCTTYRILSSPLLFETRQNELVDYTLAIDVPKSIQLERASIRDDSKPDLIEKVISSQISRDERLKLSDFVIDNSGTKAATAEAVKNLHTQFLTLTKK